MMLDDALKGVPCTCCGVLGEFYCSAENDLAGLSFFIFKCKPCETLFAVES